MDIFQHIGIPKECLRQIENDRFIAIIQKAWLKYTCIKTVFIFSIILLFKVFGKTL